MHHYHTKKEKGWTLPDYQLRFCAFLPCHNALLSTTMRWFHTWQFYFSWLLKLFWNRGPVFLLLFTNFNVTINSHFKVRDLSVKMQFGFYLEEFEKIVILNFLICKNITLWCNLHHYLFTEHFHHSKQKLYTD